jgi:hypothetical protein
MVNDPDVLWLFNLMSKGDPKDRVIYAQVLDALCEEPFFDMLRCDNPNKYYYRAKGQNKLDTIEKRSAERARWNFKAGYGIEHAKALEDLRMSLKESAELLESYGLTPVNAAGRFLFLKGEPDAVMDDNQHFIVYGVPDWTLSVEKGVVAARLGRSLFGFGIDAVGNRGLRFDLEKELIADYFDVRSRQGQDAAQKRMDEMRQKLRSRQVPVNKLAYTVTRKKDVYSYSAYDTKRLKMINDLMLEQGQTARAVLCKNNGSVRAKRIENASPKELAIEEYDDILFGSEGSISRYYKVRATQAIMDF